MIIKNLKDLKCYFCVQFLICLKQNLPEEDNLSTRDKWPVPEVSSVQRFYCITPVTEPTDWCAPIVVAPKKGTDRICMCVDLSKLNQVCSAGALLFCDASQSSH